MTHTPYTFTAYVRIPKLRIPRLDAILKKSKYRVALTFQINRVNKDTPKELWAIIKLNSFSNVIELHPIKPDTALTDKSPYTAIINIQDMDELSSYLSIMGITIDLSNYEKKPIPVQYTDMPF